MKVVVKKVDEIKHEMRFEIPADRVSAKLEEVYKEIGKSAKIKGFRPGKVPRHILEKHHAQTAHEEMMRAVISDSYQEGLKQEDLKPIDYPEVEDVKFADGVVSFTAKLEVRPQVIITAKDYKGIKVQRKSSEVTDEEIDKTLEYFKQGQGEGVTLDDAFARGMGYPSLDEFKKTLSRQIEMDKDRQNKSDVENQIVEALIKKTKFKLPESLLKRQVEERLAQSLEHWKKQHNLSEEELQKKAEELRPMLNESVEKDIRVYFILEAIADAEALRVQENEKLPSKVMEFLLKEADWSETAEKSTKK